MIKLYTAIDSGTEGRDCYEIATFTSKEAAYQAAKGRGTFGVGDGPIKESKAFESFADYQRHDIGYIRERALAKLTAEERAALGYK